MRKCFFAGLFLFASCFTAAVAANDTFFIRTNMYDLWFTSWPHEYCNEISPKKLECKGAAPNGSTVTANAGGANCYIDFAQPSRKVKFKGTRGHCEARLSGNSIIVR